jgi:uncharacterized protein with NRDE domain
MCVVALAWDIHPRWRLLLIGNRDEAHARPSAPLAHWADAPEILAGRDLEAGGTWMGVHESGRAAVVTNVRDPRAAQERASRGLLVSDFLRGDAPAKQHAEALQRHAGRYRPFNLLLFDGDSASCVSNHPRVCACELAPGLHGLSNGNLDATWPKVRRATTALQAWLDAGDSDFEPLFAALADETPAPDAELPDTGIGLELERRVSPPFVRGAIYGTRATTLIGLDGDGNGCIIERRFGADGEPQGQIALRF